jgi:CRP/FNR family transcriptional regulator, cyclic AMP receptor protein
MEWRLLQGLPAEEVRQVLAITRRRRFSKGDVVFHEDDPGDSLHLIGKGRFAVRVMTPLGDVATIAVRGAGESFGEMALIDRKVRRAATVLALEEAETFAVYETDFARLRREHPSIDRVLLAFLANEVRMLNQRLLEALYMPVEKRVRRRLIELAGQYPGPDGKPLITLTQEAIAELAGASRATTNQVLRDEETRGAIELKRGQTRVLDLDALRKRAR